MKKKLRRKGVIHFPSFRDGMNDLGIGVQQEIQDLPDAIEVYNREVLALCIHGHIIRDKKEVLGRCHCDHLLCERCPELVCQRCGHILCRKCAYVEGDLILCNRHNFFLKLAAQLAISSREE